MPLTLEQYAAYLDTRDLPWPAPPVPQPPRARPHLVAMPEVRVVTWNVYGTLLAISTGGLVFEHPQKFVMDIALDKTVEEFKMWGAMSRKPGQPAEYLGKIYTACSTELRLAPSPGEKYPEILAEQSLGRRSSRNCCRRITSSTPAFTARSTSLAARSRTSSTPACKGPRAIPARRRPWNKCNRSAWRRG